MYIYVICVYRQTWFPGTHRALLPCSCWPLAFLKPFLSLVPIHRSGTSMLFTAGIHSHFLVRNVKPEPSDLNLYPTPAMTGAVLAPDKSPWHQPQTTTPPSKSWKSRWCPLARRLQRVLSKLQIKCSTTRLLSRWQRNHLPGGGEGGNRRAARLAHPPHWK